ncbi:MAG: 30S ribosomal protein S17 [Desulfurivibrio sp.]|nr:30S ribosomal protein S17 [Desulfurivibrio sp.]
MSAGQGSKKTQEGLVVGNKMDKTIVIETTRFTSHKLYGKYIRRHVKYLADDPENVCQVGDRVLIEECRPLSRRKRWRLRSVLEQAV